LLVGAGGHAKACIDVIEAEGQFDISGIVGLPPELGKSVLAYKVIAQDEDLPQLRERFAHAFVTAGHIRGPELRRRLFDLLQRYHFNLPIVVSPNAYVSSHADLGPGTIVMHGAVVNAGATIGCNCIINSQALIEHDAGIGDHCHISTAAVVNGGVRIGEGAFIGSNSTLRQYITIGEGCFIGMGQKVIADCGPGTRLTQIKDAE